MIATIQDLDREPNQEASGQTAAYLDACNLLFEQELLSRRRISNRDSPVLANIRRGMSFFEEWAAAHDDTGNCWSLHYCTSRIETQAKLYNKLSFPILPETVVGTIHSIEKPNKLAPLLATCIQHSEKIIYV